MEAGLRALGRAPLHALDRLAVGVGLFVDHLHVAARRGDELLAGLAAEVPALSDPGTRDHT
ncbi:hypothetical protein B1T51_25415, partial [Mycobacterium kansasii]